MTKDELIEKHRDINVDHGWWGDTYGDFVNRLGEAGLTVLKENMRFSGFWSQGDGACFTMVSHNLQDLHTAASKWVDEERKAYVGANEAGEEELQGGEIIAALDQWCQHLMNTFLPHQLNARMKAVLKETRVYIGTGRDRYSHSATMYLHHEARLDDEEEEAILDDIDFDALQSLARGLADALYETLEQEYDYQTSDEAVWEAIEANGLDDELDADEAVPTNEENHPCCD